MSYKLEEGHKALSEGFSELVNNRNNFQDAISLDLEDVKTTVYNIKETTNASCRLADQAVSLLLGDTHINQEGKVSDQKDVIGLEDIKTSINNFAGAITDEIKDQGEVIKTHVYEQGWNDDSIGEINGSVNDIDNKLDELESSIDGIETTVSNIEDSITSLGDIDLSSVEIVSDKLDDLTQTLDRTDLEELNSDINTLTKISTDVRSDVARLHDSVNSQFDTLTNMVESTNTQFNSLTTTIDAQVKENLSLGRTFENYLESYMPKYFDTMKNSIENVIDEKFAKHNQELKDQTHSQLEDQEGTLFAMENKLETLDNHVKRLLSNIAYLEEFSAKSTDKELGEKIHNAIANGFTNLNCHVEDIVTEVKRIKEESILTNYNAHTNNNEDQPLQEEKNV
jgi:archaellum component FlaC